MLVPVIRKFAEAQDILIERALPAQGIVHSHEGTEVKPFDRIGECVISHKKLVLPPAFKPVRSKSDKQFYYFGSTLGSAGSKKVIAPFNGYLVQQNIDNKKVYEFNEVDNKYMLLSGVWGKVEHVLDGRSVLLKTQTRDLLFAACTKVSITGELVVFPNPTEILEEYYLEEFAKEAINKIVYIGNFATPDLVKKAVHLGVGGIIAGSASKSTFALAKSHGLAFGIISGFGKIRTPDPVFQLLSLASYRQAFFQGERNLLRIPVPPEGYKEENVLTFKSETKNYVPVKRVEKGMNVFVFQKPFVGRVGVVDSVGEYSIFVRFDTDDVEVRVPNFFIIE